MKGRIQSIEFSYLVHATEDQARIQRAVEDMVGVPANPDVERLEGHFGNEILIVRTRLTGDPAWESTRSLIAKMSPSLLREVSAQVESHLDEHSAMFLRFDKQALVAGSLALGLADSVRVKIKPRAYLMRSGAAGFFRDLLEGV